MLKPIGIVFALLCLGFSTLARAETSTDCPDTPTIVIPGPPRLALVIAISDYDGNHQITDPVLSRPGFLRDLPNAVHDGTALRGALCRLGFRVTFVANPTKVEMETELARFGGRLAASPDSVALVYYSGHAIQVSGVNWLIPSEARLPADLDLTQLPEQVQAGFIEAHAVALATVFRYFRSPTAGSGGVNLIFIDACRNNPWEERLFGPARGSATRGLADQSSPSRVGTLIAYSTAVGDVASDGQAGGNSPFAAAILELIEQPGLDIREMLTRVRVMVRNRTGQAQATWENSSLVEPFCFAGCEVARAPAAGEPERRRSRPNLAEVSSANIAAGLSCALDGSSARDRSMLVTLFDDEETVGRTHQEAVDRFNRHLNGCAARLRWSDALSARVRLLAVYSITLDGYRSTLRQQQIDVAAIDSWFDRQSVAVRTNLFIEQTDLEGLFERLEPPGGSATLSEDDEDDIQTYVQLRISMERTQRGL